MTTPRRVLLLFALVAAWASGCSAGGTMPGSGGGKGGSTASGGSTGAGGFGDSGSISNADAAGARDGGPSRDGSRGEVQTSNLSADAPTFKWDACVGCADSSASGSGGAGGTAGSSGTSAVGGAVGSGGVSGKGGSTGSGGTVGSGGTAGGGGSKADAGPTYDAPPMPLDATSDGGLADAGAVLRDAPGPDTSQPPDVLADLRPADSLPPDTATHCVAQIESVVPATDSFMDFGLVAGPNLQVVLRASVVSGGPATAASWSWQANRDGTPISAVLGTQDPASAAFTLTVGGNYSFTATDKTGACSVTVQNRVAPADLCLDCGHNLNLRFAPPPSTNIPVQSGYLKLAGSPPFTQETLVLSSGVAVQVAPSVGSGLVSSYVRINASGGDLVADGLSDPQSGGFGAELLAANNAGTLLKYDVLVVPIDGPSGETVGATAPQLFQSLTPAIINTTSFSLAGGVSVTGSTLNSSGQGVADVRVMLSNQNPAVAAQPSRLVFSSVGRSDAQGKFSLNVQRGGTYWVSISPPVGGGLPEAVAPTAIYLNDAATLGFSWNAVSLATLTLNVVDAAGSPSVGTRVRLTSAQANPVGTLTFASGQQSANGNVQIEGTTSATGSVAFVNLPDGATYNALLVPATLGLFSATTSVSVTLPTGGGSQTVSLLAQGKISGQLTSAGGSTPIDWTHVEVIAYDRSNDTPEIPAAAIPSKDGTFSMGVSPGRIYVLLAVPDASTPLARTFVGPGPMQATEFTFTQNVPNAMPWSSTVMDGFQNGLEQTAMQVFCIAEWPYCVDPTIPLAETTSGDGGAFQFALPDPATR